MKKIILKGKRYFISFSRHDLTTGLHVYSLQLDRQINLDMLSHSKSTINPRATIFNRCHHFSAFKIR